MLIGSHHDLYQHHVLAWGASEISSLTHNVTEKDKTILTRKYQYNILYTYISQAYTHNRRFAQQTIFSIVKSQSTSQRFVNSHNQPITQPIICIINHLHLPSSPAIITSYTLTHLALRSVQQLFSKATRHARQFSLPRTLSLTMPATNTQSGRR